MRKALTYLFLVVAAWVCMELGSQGTQGAFGGRFAGWFAPIGPVRPEGTQPPSPITHQVRDHLNGVMDQYERDRNRLAGPSR